MTFAPDALSGRCILVTGDRQEPDVEMVDTAARIAERNGVLAELQWLRRYPDHA